MQVSPNPNQQNGKNGSFTNHFTILTHQDTLSKNPKVLETYGADLLLLEDFSRQQVWSLLETENGRVVRAGKHLIGLIGYVITQEPWSVKREQYAWTD